MTIAHPGVTTTLTISGMTCGHCVQHVQGALAALPGVAAEVDLDSATATVRHVPEVDVEALVAAVEEAGYSAEPTHG